ncbi:transmembrane 9 superfamily member 1-like [Styela clava]
MALPVIKSLFLTLAILPWLCVAEKRYQYGEKVDVFMNKVGPYYNPHQTYPYYEAMHVCEPKELRYEPLSLSQVLNGDRKVKSGYDVKFGVTKKNSDLCVLNIQDDTILKKFQNVISEFSYYEMYVDDLRVRGFVGEYESSRYIDPRFRTNYSDIFNDITINIAYNNVTSTIVSVNITTDRHPPFDLNNEDVPFGILIKYDVIWTKTELTREQALKRDLSQRTSNVRAFSLLNSIIVAFFLTSMAVAALLKARRDLQLPNNEKDLPLDVGVGIYALPRFQSLLSALLGVGGQLIFIFVSLLIYKCIWYYDHTEGAICIIIILLYIVSSFIAGYVSASYYRKMHGVKWTRNIILSAFLFTAPTMSIWFIINTIHWANSTTLALPYTTVLIIIALWCIFGFSLNLFGGILGKNVVKIYDPPFGIESTPFIVPKQPWYKSTIIHLAFGGFGFSVIAIEIYFFMTSLWERQVFVFQSWILFAQIFLAFWVTMCMSIVLTNVQIASKNVYWWWKSFFHGGTFGIYVMLYSLHYYFKRSNMDGFVQGVTYFGSMFLISFAASVMFGTISFLASFAFIQYRLSKSNFAESIELEETKQLESET